MAGGVSTAEECSDTVVALGLIREIDRISSAGFSGFFKKDCADLVRRVSLLAHLLEEIRDSVIIEENGEVGSSSPHHDLILALRDAKGLLFAANNFDNSQVSSDAAQKRIFFQFQCVTSKLEKALANLPYNDLDISEEVKEQVELVRTQLRRAIGRYGDPESSFLYGALAKPLDKEFDPLQLSNRIIGNLQLKNIVSIDHQFRPNAESLIESKDSEHHAKDEVIEKKEGLSRSSTSSEITGIEDSDEMVKNRTGKSLEEIKDVGSQQSSVIPVDFLCPISLELMRDPVTVATGQTYERSYIQRWIDCGYKTCPKSRQKLEHLNLTPNYVLLSLISQWCAKNNADQLTALVNGKIRNTDGTFRDVTGDLAAIEALVRKLSSRSTDDLRAAVAEIRSLSKRSTDNRILLADAGAIPLLVNLLASQDAEIQENAVTSILNLSIYDNNKELIMLANAIPSIVQVLRTGSMEAKENAAATLFCLSMADENKIIIGASGAIPPLVDLLENGSSRGKKDAATALFNLCMHHRNKGQAIRQGIISALSDMLTDSASGLIDESLAIVAVLASHQEAKVAIVKANMIPVLIDVLRSDSPRNKENAVSVLLSLCKRKNENLACVSRHSALIPLSELAESGTERAKRKAVSLLELLGKLQLQHN